MISNVSLVALPGEQLRPVDLEPGDVIAAEGVNVSGRYVADEIEVARNVRLRQGVRQGSSGSTTTGGSSISPPVTWSSRAIGRYPGLWKVIT